MHLPKPWIHGAARRLWEKPLESGSCLLALAATVNGVLVDEIAAAVASVCH
jgi:hypothetical protein